MADAPSVRGTVLRACALRRAIIALAPAGAVVQVETEAPLPAGLRLAPPCPLSADADADAPRQQQQEHVLLPPVRWDGARGVLVAQGLAPAGRF